MTPSPTLAEDNIWTKPTSGNWEEDHWSLGVLPAPGQSIFITNAGWKAVAIASNTQNFPQALNVFSVTLSSPVDSYNVLLFNYPGQAVPLSTRFFNVASNSTVRMLNGALNLTGGGGEGMSLGGEFFQEAGSTVLGSQMEIGYIGPGVYNLVSGNVWLQHVWIGGAYNGRMIQTGGTNGANIVHIDAGGHYTLIDGDYNAVQTYFGQIFSAPGFFTQQGGRINTGLQVYKGTYRLEGGYVYDCVKVPVSDGFSSSGGSGLMIQTGGTNFAALSIGEVGGNGEYHLSNGVSRPPSVILGGRGNANQWGGSQIISGTFTTRSEWIARQMMGHGRYTLNGGSLQGVSMELGGLYVQNGGVATFSGDINMVGSEGGFLVNGGELHANSALVRASWNGYKQTGGKHVLTTRFTVLQEAWQSQYACRLEGGELLSPEIVVAQDASFLKSGGSLLQSGLFRLQVGKLWVGPGTHLFGRLDVRSEGTGTNNSLSLPSSNITTIVRFAQSSAEPWDATLTIQNWRGTWTGGGFHQLFVGSDANGLTSQQIARVRFLNPAGYTAGFYAAKQLGTGEIVPDALPPTSRIPPTLAISRVSAGVFQIDLSGEASANYAIEVSDDLAEWVQWTTTQAGADGTATVTDYSGSAPTKYYRALLMP